MRRTLQSFGRGWWETIPTQTTPEERHALQQEDDPDLRSAALRGIEGRSRRPALPDDASAAESILRKHHRGDYTSASVVLPVGHGHVSPAGGGLVRF